ncbi:MAG: DUF432 domain-containing protein [Acidilobaceae archaeon]
MSALRRLYGSHLVDADEYRIQLDEAGALVVAREQGDFIRVFYESKWGSRSLGLIPVSIWPLRLDVKPHPPRGWRVQVKRALVRLREPLNMLKGSYARLAVELPVDLGVYVNGALAGSLPVGRVKYAVYGTPDLGDPCRYVDFRILEEIPGYLRGSLVVDVHSRFEEDSVQIARIVVPTLGLGSYLARGEKPVFSRVSLEVHSKTTGLVRAKREPSVEAEEEVLALQPDSFYLMRFGF